MWAIIIVATQVMLAGVRPSLEPDPLVFGLFIASIEEGARAFTPVRLLPFDHADAFNHEFPNALVNHTSEVEALVELGEHSGLRLGTTFATIPAPTSRGMGIPRVFASAAGQFLERLGASVPMGIESGCRILIYAGPWAAGGAR